MYICLNLARYDHPFTATLYHLHQVMNKLPPGIDEYIEKIEDENEREAFRKMLTNSKDLYKDLESITVLLELQQENLGRV